MSTHKCNYMIFTSDKSFDANLDIELFGTKIKMNEEVTFLGIRFGKHLSFKNQISYLTLFKYDKETLFKRMNVLKVLVNRSWGLSIKLMDYSSILSPAFSATNMHTLTKMFEDYSQEIEI
jgi:hypothetical protein